MPDCSGFKFCANCTNTRRFKVGSRFCGSAIVEQVDDDGNVIDVKTLTNDQPLSLLAYGVVPTFYEFTETQIDLRFWVSFWVRSTHVESRSDFNKNIATKWRS